MIVKRPRKPRYLKMHLGWLAVVWQLATSLAGVIVMNAFWLSPIEKAGPNTPQELPAFSLVFFPWLVISMAGIVPFVLHARTVFRRLRETNCHICHDCGYDLREHTDATPCPECGRVWNQAPDTEVWRTLYKGHLKH